MLRVDLVIKATLSSFHCDVVELVRCVCTAYFAETVVTDQSRLVSCTILHKACTLRTLTAV